MAIDLSKYKLNNMGMNLGGLYGRLRGHNTKALLGQFGTDFRTAAGIPQDAALWTKANGIQLGNLPSIDPKTGASVAGTGTSLGSLANIGSGIYQGGTAIKGLLDVNSSVNDRDDLISSIKKAKISNPMYDMYLDSDQESLLRKLGNGSASDGGLGGAGKSIFSNLPKTLLQSGLGFVTGGVPGALINGIGGLVNSGIQGYGSGVDENTAALESLYQNLQQAQQEYKTMKRPSNLRSAGLQSQYYNQLY